MPRFLQKNHACQQWGSLIFWDTETNSEVVPGQPNQQKLTLRLGVGRYLRRESGKNTRHDSVRYKDNETFWKWFISKLNKKRPTYAFAHNIGFDLSVSGFWDLLDRGVFVLSESVLETGNENENKKVKKWKGCFCDEDPPTIICVKHVESGAKVTFLDSMNYYRHSLDAIGKKLGCLKSKMPEMSEPDSVWFDYCEQDVIVLETAMTNLMSWFSDNDYGNFKMTQASLAMAAFRHRFMRCLIDLRSSPFQDDIEKDSYYGGRLELFQKGEVKGITTQLDIVSQYPACMRSKLYPIQRLACSDTSFTDISIDDLSIEYIAKVRLKTSRSRYPLRTLKRGTIFPTGEFISTLAGPELLAAKKAGDIQEILSWSKYKLRPLFRDFVTHFFDRRQVAKDAGDDQESYFLKILMNSLYGKFGQQTPEWCDLDSKNDLPLWIQSHLDEPDYNDKVRNQNPNAPQFFLWSNSESRDRIKYRTVGKHCQISQKRKPHKNSFCAISSYVTSYARNMIDDIIQIAGMENCYYVVTDAVFVSKNGLNRLRDRGKIDPGRLGGLAIENQGTNGEFTALHHYRLDHKRKFGSRKPRTQLICTSCNAPVVDVPTVCPTCDHYVEELRVAETQFEGIRGVLRSNSRNGVIVTSRLKDYERKYDRGTIGRDNRIIPLNYQVKSGRNILQNQNQN